MIPLLKIHVISWFLGQWIVDFLSFLLDQKLVHLVPLEELLSLKLNCSGLVGSTGRIRWVGGWWWYVLINLHKCVLEARALKTWRSFRDHVVLLPLFSSATSAPRKKQTQGAEVTFPGLCGSLGLWYRCWFSQPQKDCHLYYWGWERLKSDF